MPEKCRVGLCGFDPMIVRGYVKTGFRAIWFYLPDELFADYDVQIGDRVKGTLLGVINGKEEKTFSPNEPFEWLASKETGYAVLVPPDAITKYELTEFHFVELQIDQILRKEAGGPIGRDQDEFTAVDVYPGEVKQRKWWPDGKMKLKYILPYAAP
ncbi:MAG: hypothetical protein FJ134_16480 [Deltaproteobacteria bacterium]|nr:hypothetical protein [Deltaproteobacteria bacterium]